MEIVKLAQHILHKHYPREHLYVAAALAGFALVILLLPDDQKGPAVSNQSIPLSVVLQENTSATDAIESQTADFDIEDYVVTDEVIADTITNLDSEAESYPWQNVQVQSGDNLSTIFQKVGLSDQEMFRILNSSEEAKVLNRLYPGYELDFMIPEQGQLEQLRVLKSPLEGYLFKRSDSGYAVESILKEAQLRQSFKVGTIADSLFMAGQKEQIPAIHIMEMANIFGGVIDFILDPRQGDQFSILYEEKYLDGEFIGNGEILATQYTNEGKTYTAVRYIDDEGEVGFYNPEGESMRKAFLRNPLDVFRISSNFNPRRRHPILNTIRAHKGTDYAAPTGTPVRATSDGRVSWAARNGSFGNLIVVKHAGGFETKYAHLSRYAVRKGERVRQGDVIGYVGATGGATGPHLHYEFLMSGVHQNPRTVHDKLPKAESIEAAEMDSFRTQTAGLLQQFSNLNNSLFLSINQPSAD